MLRVVLRWVEIGELTLRFEIFACCTLMLEHVVGGVFFGNHSNYLHSVRELVLGFAMNASCRL